MQEKRLSQQENCELNKIVAFFPNNPTLTERCISYFYQAKKNGSHIPNDKIQIAMKCAYFMAQKSQVFYNLKGQRIRQAGLSLNILIKAHKHDVIYILKQMFKKITIQDKQVADDIQNTINQISFLITFSVKLEKTFKYLEMKQIKENAGYQNTFMSLAWLFYIEAKNVILQRSMEVIDNTCLLSHVISFMVIYGWNYFRSQLIIKNNLNMSSIKEISYLVKNKCLEHLKITDMEYYKRIAQKFQNFIHQKFLQGILKQKQNNDFLSYELLHYNYKRFDQYYMKKIDINSIDERIFFKDRATNFTPSKFTPFGNKGWANKLNRKTGNNISQRSKQHQLSHRILNYQMFDQQEKQSSKNVITPSQLKLPQGIIQTPSSMNIPLIQTPISAAMEMFNYLNSKAKKFNQKNYIFTKSDNIIIKYIDTVFQKQKKAKSAQQLKKKLVFSLYKIYTHQFFTQNPQQRTCQEIFTAFLAVLIQLVFFVNNIHVELQQIQKELNISTFQEWKACDFMLKSDKLMPIVLKTHLLDIEVSIVSYKIWKNQDMLFKIDSFFSKKSVSNDYQEKLCRRIIHQIAYETTQISSEVALLQDSSQRVFQLIKGILQHKSELLFNRHLDQIIICSFYLIFRMQNIPKKFNDVKQAYMQVNPNNKHMHSQIMTRAQANSEQLKSVQLKEGQNHLDIIMFYNKIFVTNVRHILPVIKKNQSNQIQTKAQFKNINGQKSSQHNLAQLLQSPLKTIIPRQTNLINKNHQNKGPRAMTPQLFAYSQSPILKSEFTSKLVKNKKIINFDEQQKNIQQELVNNQQKQVGEIQLGQFISKRTKPCLSQRSNIQNISPRNQAYNGNMVNTGHNTHLKQYQKPTIKKSSIFLGINPNGNYQLK